MKDLGPAGAAAPACAAVTPGATEGWRELPTGRGTVRPALPPARRAKIPVCGTLDLWFTEEKPWAASVPA